MRHLYIYILILGLIFTACEDDNKSGHKQQDNDQEMEQVLNTEPGESPPISADEQRLPLIDNIDVEINQEVYVDSATIRGKDANYYNIYVFESEKYYVTVEASNPYARLIIYSPHEGKIYEQNTDGEVLSWEGQFESAGKATFNVMHASGMKQEEQVTDIIFTVRKE